MENPIEVDITNNIRTLTQHHLNIMTRSETNLEINQTNKHLTSSKPISFSFYEIFSRHLPCKSKKLSFKNILFEKASKKMDYYFDIFSYIKKMQEIDIMKYLLLDKDQIKLLNFISKPSISQSYSDSDDVYKNYQQNRLIKSKLKIEELEDIIKSYNSLKNRSDDLNNRLFYLFDYEIDHLVIG